MNKIFNALFMVTFLFACNSGPDSGSDGTSIDAGSAAPAVIPFTIVNEFPHDTGSYTEGLSFYKGQLYESTGATETISNNGTWVGPVEISTGKFQKKIDLGNAWFGEGTTFLNDKIYQLTYKAKKGFVYDAKTYKKLKEFTYNTEGWGLTNDGKSLIMSDGTSSLYFLDPESLRILNVVGVSDNNGAIPNINELEYINGFIFANQWQTPYMLKIDPASGKVVGRMDFSKMVDQIKNQYPDAEEFNGIAYDSTTQKIYVTGKKWPRLYEIKFL
ncbi:MAG: glutaminyl-peptide cyclotransferase [Flavitalea sp.]